MADSKENDRKKIGKTEEGYLEVTGGKVWYRILGSDKKKMPLIVVHGGPGATHDYLETIGDLSAQRPVVFYDQLGSGNSDRPMDKSLYAVPRFVDELDRLIKKTGCRKAFLLGSSWGTMIISKFMEKGSENVAGIIFSGPAISSKMFTRDARSLIKKLPEDSQKAIYEGEKKGEYNDEYQRAMLLYYSKFLCMLEPYPDCLKRTLEKMAPFVYEYMWGPSEFTCTGTLKDFDGIESIKRIKVPVLFTCGRYDEATPQTTRYYSDQIPGSKVVIFENASHSHHLEKRDEYNKCIMDFLSEID